MGESTIHHCKQVDRVELQVVNDGQLEVLCPKCGFYCKGQCANPNRHKDSDPCPFDGKPLPVEVVEEEGNG